MAAQVAGESTYSTGTLQSHAVLHVPSTSQKQCGLWTDGRHGRRKANPQGTASH